MNLNEYCKKLDIMVRADFYEYNHNGSVVVYGENCYGNNMVESYWGYDSLADVKRAMKQKGIRNWSKMKKLSREWVL